MPVTATPAAQPIAGHNFKVGDKAVYPTQGVGEVIRIVELDNAGRREMFYELRILDTDASL